MNTIRWILAAPLFFLGVWAVAGRTDVVAYLRTHGTDPCELLYGDERPLAKEADEARHSQIAELLREASRQMKSSA